MTFSCLMSNKKENNANERKILSTPKNSGVLVRKPLTETFLTHKATKKSGDVDTSQFQILLFFVLKENVKEKERNGANESSSYDRMIVKYLNENKNSDKTRFEEEEKRLRKCF